MEDEDTGREDASDPVSSRSRLHHRLLHRNHQDVSQHSDKTLGPKCHTRRVEVSGSCTVSSRKQIQPFMSGMFVMATACLKTLGSLPSSFLVVITVILKQSRRSIKLLGTNCVSYCKGRNITESLEMEHVIFGIGHNIW